MPSQDYAGIQVQGARQLRKALREQADELQNLKDVHKKAAEVAARSAKGYVPEGPSGKLAKSVRAAGTKTAGIIRAGSKRVPYANAVNWGRRMWPNVTSPRAVESFVYPRLFLNKGAKEAEPRWLKLYTDAVEKAIEKIEKDTHP